jgi:hypothetical protein
MPDGGLHQSSQAPGEVLATWYAPPDCSPRSWPLPVAHACCSLMPLASPGGSTECKVPNCVNRAKSRGFCWSHGGGTKCKAPACEKIAISNGLCWAHGGGTITLSAMFMSHHARKPKIIVGSGLAGLPALLCCRQALHRQELHAPGIRAHQQLLQQPLPGVAARRA